MIGKIARALILSSLLFAGISCSMTDDTADYSEELDLAEHLQNIEPVPDSARSYLSKNAYSLDADTADFSFVDSGLSGKQVFLAGEIHSSADMVANDFKLLKYLHAKTKFRYYIYEIDFLTAQKINRYLHNGNTAALDTLYAYWPSCYFNVKEKRKTFELLREYNQALPASERITILGLDVATVNIVDFIDEAKKCIPEGTASPEIAESIDLLSGTDPRLMKIVDVSLIIDALYENYQLYNDAYRAFFGKRFVEFAVCIQSMYYWIKFCDTSLSCRERKSFREKGIYENFCRFYETDPSASYYGQWGRDHVRLKTAEGVQWMGARINAASSPAAGKVLSIYYGRENCKGWDEMMTVSASVSDPRGQISCFSEVADSLHSRITAFRLCGKNSPFAESLYLFDSENSAGGSTSEYIQYYILFKDSPATTPNR